jgi:hypothetical protein
MRKYFLTAFVLVAMLAFASSGFALEKTAARMTADDRLDDWNANTTCSVAYYNTCTGWVWIWSGWSSGDKIGVCFENCCPSHGSLDASWQYVWTAAPSGYGFTGTISVNDTDPDCCKGAELASQTYLPISGWNTYLWGATKISGPSFVVQVELGTSTLPNPISYATDHPAAGPTGPVACGTCYPTTRANHSFYYGTAASPLCPGSPLNDGVCDAQLLWGAGLTCKPISVEETSWSTIKGLYR